MAFIRPSRSAGVRRWRRLTPRTSAVPVRTAHATHPQQSERRAEVAGRGADHGARCSEELYERAARSPPGHVGALRAAGLVSAHRAGRHVLYARTRIAEELVAGAGR
ncbi:hypothetical protein [Streptomyces sp. NPDC012756]|uniref:hypothetical protein n=1 Tax=Streptomyces sp. NPDC012756 TaxID=3364847 RepID=UPI00368EAD9A